MNSEKSIVVTGAAAGIGFATAQRLVRDGFSVAALDRDGEGLSRLSRACSGLAGRCTTDRIDIADFEALEGVLAELSRSTHLYALVNNAGVSLEATVCDTSVDDWARVLSINIDAVFRACRAVIPPMVSRGEGVIINVSSVAGLVGVRERAAYCTSKAAILGLTRSIAADYAAQGIRANAICPGSVDTERIRGMIARKPDPAAAREEWENRQLDGRMGSVEEIAGTVSFLVSEDARFFNGASIVIDGGMTAV